MVNPPTTLAGACQPTDVVCSANVAVTSYTSDLWHTFAHEMG